MLQTKEEVVELLVRPNAFRSWLSEKDPSSLVGTSRNTTSCPIARFLRDSGVEAEVHSQHISVPNPKNIFFFSYVLHKEDLGDWVEDFIYSLDEEVADEVKYQHIDGITAKEALELLNNITEGVF